MTYSETCDPANRALAKCLSNIINQEETTHRGLGHHLHHPSPAKLRSVRVTRLSTATRFVALNNRERDIPNQFVACVLDRQLSIHQESTEGLQVPFLDNTQDYLEFSGFHPLSSLGLAPVSQGETLELGNGCNAL